MKVVSNTSPLIALARIGNLQLLHQLYGEIFIPEAVWHEVIIGGSDRPGANEIKSASWVKTQAIANKPLVQALRQDLDAGEAEAIVLALEVEADFLLMDEHLGRETADLLGLRYIGTIGVLISAKRHQVIKEIRPYLDTLRNVAGFWVDDELYLRILKDEAEI